MPVRYCTALTLTLVALSAAANDSDPNLCASAQRLLINAGDDLPVIEQRGASNGFHTIQMGIDHEKQAAIIAMTTHTAQVDGQEQATYIACKMVDRDRVNDMLGLQLPGPDRQCRDVNEATLQSALAKLTPAQRARYQSEGRQLRFADDALLATGGEWLPVTMDLYISVAANNDVTVRAPSVRVPWNPVEKNFYQGVQHCKLISLAAMQRWVTKAAFEAGADLIPPTDTACNAPHSMTSTVGSCLFYFAPADSLFCQDYSGAEWTADAAQQECANRHASKDALAAAKNRYDGAGGAFSDKACNQRTDTPDIAGTCVFHCNAGDETLWHISGTIDPRMTRGCDLFIDGR